MPNPFDIQIDGDHYKGLAIQPAEFNEKNNLSFLEGCIVKRICRYKTKPGTGRKDLEKIKHEVDMLIELNYSEHVLVVKEKSQYWGMEVA